MKNGIPIFIDQLGQTLEADEQGQPIDSLASLAVLVGHALARSGPRPRRRPARSASRWMRS